MATFIVMPRLSPTMEEGVLAKWTKNEGDKIVPGDTIAEVETDKANMDFPLEDEGVLLKRLVAEGTTVKLGSPVGILGKKGEDFSQLLKEAESPSKTVSKEASSKDGLVDVSSSKAISSTKASPSSAIATSAASSTVAKPEGVTSHTNAPTSDRVLASPLAKRIAKDAGISLERIEGTGPNGRIVKRDVEQAGATPGTSLSTSSMATSSLGTASKSRPASQIRQTETEQILPMSMMRKTIAKRLTESKQTVPHFYLTTEASVDSLWQLREQINQSLANTGTKISINDFIVKATARALRFLPQANMSYSEQGAIQHHRVDVGVAVALPDGLLTPIVREADQKSIGTLSEEIRDLAERGRQKKLHPEEYQGATFSVSNLGMYGIREFFAIINPPESGILAAGKVEKRPVVVESKEGDKIVVSRRITLTLSCDHRIVDGALGAQLLAEIKKGIENPWLLVM